jgi:hypothetical protein
MIEDVAKGREVDRYNKWKALGEKNGWLAKSCAMIV